MLKNMLSVGETDVALVLSACGVSGKHPHAVQSYTCRDAGAVRGATKPSVNGYLSCNMNAKLRLAGQYFSGKGGAWCSEATGKPDGRRQMQKARLGGKQGNGA